MIRNTLKLSVDARLENFDDMVERRRCEAQRSIIVQMAGEGSASVQHLLEDCSQIGPVNTMMEYNTITSKPTKKKQVFLICLQILLLFYSLN